MSDKNIETITHGLEPIALIIRADYDKPGIQLRRPALFRNAGRNIDDRSEAGSFRWRRRQEPIRRGMQMIPAIKLITTGECGMVLTNDPACVEKARSLRNLCYSPASPSRGSISPSGSRLPGPKRELPV
jgi:hypothetical protein